MLTHWSYVFLALTHQYVAIKIMWHVLTTSRSIAHTEILTHCPLGDLNRILDKQFSSSFQWLMAELSFVKLSSDECQARRFPLPYGPGQVKLPVGQVDLNRSLLFISYKQIKEFQNSWSQASDDFEERQVLLYCTNDSGNGLVPSGNKPLPKLMLTQMYVTIWHH